MTVMAGGATNKTYSRILPNSPEPKRISLQNVIALFDLKTKSTRPLPACRRFTGEAEHNKLSARASVIRNVRVVRLARTLTLRFIFLSYDLYAQN